MNYIIGMCKRHKDWISTLADHGYEPELIEQQIRTSSDELVKPDILATSNKLIHSLVFECKGGVTVDADQLRRYSTLTEDNVLRWTRPFTHQNFHFDVCLADVEENHPVVVAVGNRFPIITFGAKTLFKTNDFKEKRLDEAFKVPIGLDGKTPPLSYYPFCEDDENAYLSLFVLRGLVSMAVKNAKGGPSTSEENIITRDDLLKSIFNPVFDALSKSHKDRLKEKIKEVVHWIMAKEGMKEALGLIETQAGIKIGRPLEKFTKEAYKFIETVETQRPLIEFMNQKKPENT
jgi:hypothetical protein